MLPQCAWLYSRTITANTIKAKLMTSSTSAVDRRRCTGCQRERGKGAASCVIDLGAHRRAMEGSTHMARCGAVVVVKKLSRHTGNEVEKWERVLELLRLPWFG